MCRRSKAMSESESEKQASFGEASQAEERDGQGEQEVGVMEKR